MCVYRCLSLRDLKATRIEAYLFVRLKQTVHNFIRHLKDEEPTGTYVGFDQHVLETATVGDVLELLASKKVHRVFIVNDPHQKKLLGLVSLQDLLLMVLNAAAPGGAQPMELSQSA